MKKSNRIFLLSGLIAVLLIGWGVLDVFRTYDTGREIIDQEYDKHLFDQVLSIDHTVTRVIDRCRTELGLLINYSAALSTEETFLASGDAEPLREYVIRSGETLSQRLSDVIVFYRGEILFSRNGRDRDEYINIRQDDSASILFCEDEQGKSYIGYVMRRGDMGYAALLELRLFFERCVNEKIYDDYWIVLYDSSTGLLIQNEGESPGFVLMSEEEMRTRGDGCTLISESERSGKVIATDYTFASPGTAAAKHCRISVLPSNLGANGNFAVAISIDNDALGVPVNDLLARAIASTTLFALGSMLLVLIVVQLVQRDRKADERISDLELENKMTNELLRQQKELAHHQRLETIGTLTAGVAHEFSNLLTPIMGNALMMIEKTPEDSENYDALLAMYDASRRAKEIVSNLTALSRKSKGTKETLVSPDQLVRRVNTLSESSRPKAVETVLQLRSGEARMLGNETRLLQMLLNLTINAYQNMAERGGLFTAATGSDDGSVWFRLSDTGTGIPQELREKIFEPFYTTKEAGKGTGLGLPIVLQIVREHDGTIEIEDVPEGGTSFLLRFPRAGEE